MLKFFSFVLSILIVTAFSSYPSHATGPDPTIYRNLMSFGPNQIKQEGDIKVDVLIVYLYAQHAGWGAIHLPSIDSYEIEFFSSDPMPKLLLTKVEYELFRDIHILPAGIENNHIVFPVGTQNHTGYSEVMLIIDAFCNIQITSKNEDGLYLMNIKNNDITLPMVYLDQIQYDTLFKVLEGDYDQMLRFDQIEWAEE